ncbi:MAG TPA: YdcF family protein [Salinivirgaceae bacterium]|nr:YdcF family protein [Salinivirgaceae bacterium]
MKRVFKIVVFVYSLFLLLAIYPGRFLRVETPIEKADAIALFLGDSYRTEFAANLYRTGYAPKIYFFSIYNNSNKTTPTQNILRMLKVPDSSIVCFHQPVQNTAEEAYQFLNQLKTIPGIQKVIVVSSPYHMRRIQFLLEYFNKKLNTDFRFIYQPTNDKRFIPQQWWLEKYSRQMVLMEYMKFAYFILIDKFNF